jgi:SPX domain protein involved in polyphosphate accumulation
MIQFVKCLRLRWYGHVEKNTDIKECLKKISTATMEGTRERVRLRERWRDEVQKDLNIMGIKNRQAMGQ